MNELKLNLRMTDSSGPSSQSDPMLDLSVPGHRALPPGHFRGPSCSSGGPLRLASLRSRDMTLVGTPKKPRRTFEPNVHVVRKSKDELKLQVTTSPKPHKLEKEEKRKERRIVKRDKPRIIQSHSIFEQGPAASTRRTGRGSLPESSSPVCDQLKMEPEEDSHTLNKLYRDDFVDDPSLKNSSKLKPIQLPLNQAPSQSVTASSSESQNMEVCQETQPSLVELLHDLHVSGRDELFFMQLPDCMPVKTVGPRTADTISYGPSKPGKRDSLPQGKASINLQTQEPSLSSFSEGYLGKLQLRRSGKVVLKLGDISMDVTEGAAFSFLQQLVSVRQSEGRSGDLMVLGNISHKLVLSPVFQTLLDQSENKNS